jgi:hypothetical protein
MLGDLFNNLIVSLGYQGKTGYTRIKGFSDTETFYVISPTAEQAGYPRKHSRLILQENGNCMVFH